MDTIRTFPEPPIKFVIDPSLEEKGCKIHIYYMYLENFNNHPAEYDYSDLYSAYFSEIRSRFTAETIKNDPIIAAYRKFYWGYLKIDPTKIRPAGEALVRRIIRKKPLPKISYFVDGYNLASAVSLVPIAAYDASKFSGNITVRHAVPGETLEAIGGKTIKFGGNELITVADDGTILSQYPYRDGDKTKITENTRNIVVAAFGVEGVPENALKNGLDLTLKFLRECRLPPDFNNDFGVYGPQYIANF